MHSEIKSALLLYSKKYVLNVFLKSTLWDQNTFEFPIPDVQQQNIIQNMIMFSFTVTV